jgi:hypothetical protein
MACSEVQVASRAPRVEASVIGKSQAVEAEAMDEKKKITTRRSHRVLVLGPSPSAVGARVGVSTLMTSKKVALPVCALSLYFFFRYRLFERSAKTVALRSWPLSE